jgi:hypothetical protein
MGARILVGTARCAVRMWEFDSRYATNYTIHPRTPQRGVPTIPAGEPFNFLSDVDSVQSGPILEPPALTS